ncbi:MAG TPA: HAD-IA family hydrolase [Candidatus Saccharimonadales bacterium]|nr:HAD-IA family hydrolase [Candidatus Saccharimonadales bacterium]
MVRAIVFDLDNTLMDFMKMKEMGVQGAVGAMLDAGLPIPAEDAHRKIYEIYRLEGIEYQRVFDEFLHTELGRIDPKLLAAAIVGYRRTRESALVVYPHTHQTLIELSKRGLRLAVVSDAPRLQAWLRLTYLQLQHLFDAVVAWEDTGRRKPSPEPFERALELLGVPAAEALMVGDWAERDVVGAKRIGMLTAFARYGDTFGTEHSGADYELLDIRDLLDVVDRLNGGPAARA